VLSKSVQVLWANSPDPLAGARLAPNPLGAGDSSIQVVLAEAGIEDRVTAEFYSLVGEHLGRADNAASAGRVVWNLNGKILGNGTYLCVLESRAGVPRRKLIKFAVAR
jgi:hypothetical protein